MGVAHHAVSTHRLNPLEVLICRGHDELDGAGIACGRARIEGPVSSALLGRAVELLGRRYPQLRGAIRTEGGGHSIVCNPEAADLACEIVENSPLSGWQQRVSAEIGRRFDVLAGPLVRVAAYLDGTRSGCDLMISAHHVVIDGISLVQLFRQIVAWLESPPAWIEPLEWRRPKRLEFHPPGFWASVIAMRRHIRWLRITRKTPKARFDRTGSFAQVCVYAVWDRNETQRLIERARREKTTVTGALVAAMAQVRAEASGERGHRQRFGVLHSLRSWHVPPIADDQVGMYVSAISVLIDDAGCAPDWELARRARAAIIADLERNGPVFLERTIAWLGALMWRLSRRKPSRRLTMHGNVNSLGSLPEISSPSGALRLTEFHWIVNSRNTPPAIEVYAVTVNGQLNLSLQSAEHDSASIVEYLNQLEERLKRMALAEGAES